MENKILLEEEIQKFKKLSGIINEATSPTNWISSLISKLTKTALPDVVVKEFEPLVAAGKIGINKSTKTITMIDWAKLTDDEVKLLFRSDEIVDIMEEIIKANGIKTSRAAMMAYKGNFKKIITGYVAGKAESRITSSAGSQASSQATAVSTSTAGKYSGNVIERLAKFFNGRIDDVTLQKLKDPNSKLRLDLENELIPIVGKEKAGLVKSSIDKAVIRVSKITESLSEEEAYNKVFETALTNMGTKLTGAELRKKYFGWFMALPWWGKFITTAVFLDGVVNPIFGTNISLLSLIKYLFNSTKEGALGGEKFEDSLNKIKNDVQSEDPSKVGPYKSEYEDFKKFIILKYPGRVKENFNLVKNTDTDWEAHYTNPADNKVYIVKYKFKNGNFEEVQ